MRNIELTRHLDTLSYRVEAELTICKEGLNIMEEERKENFMSHHASWAHLILLDLDIAGMPKHFWPRK